MFYHCTNMFIVYVLRSITSGMLYIGQSGNFAERFQRHQQGLARFTRGRGPWIVEYTEEYSTRSAAVLRERFLKSGQGRKWLEQQLNGRAGPPQVD